MKITELLEGRTVILKKWSSEKLKLDRAINLLNENCKASLVDIANGNILWRGMSGPTKIGDIAALDSTESLRTSRDTNNLYHLAMEASSNMQDVPHRSRSFICTTSVETSEQYGKIYAIFPYDGTKIAVSKTSDFIDSPIKNLSIDIGGFTTHMEDILDDLGILPSLSGKFFNVKNIDDELSKYDPRTFFIFLLSEIIEKRDELRTLFSIYTSGTGTTSGTYNITKYFKDLDKKGKLDINNLDAIIKSLKLDASSFKILEILIANPDKQFTALSSFLFNRNDLGITIRIPGSPKNVHNDRECWFSGKCIAIEYYIFSKIIEELKKNNAVHKRIIKQTQFMTEY